MTIWKFPVTITDEFTIEMPVGARVLSVDTQGGTPQMWALVEAQTRMEPRKFRLAGTGHPITGTERDYRFVGTFQMAGGRLIWHLFEDLR